MGAILDAMLKYKALEEGQDQIATGITSAFQNFMGARNQVIEQQQKAQTLELEKMKTLSDIDYRQKSLAVDLAGKGLKFTESGEIIADPNTETPLQRIEREAKAAGIEQKDRALGIKEQEVAGKNKPGALDEILKQGAAQGGDRDQLIADAKTKAEATYPGYTAGFDSTGKVTLIKKTEAKTAEKNAALEEAAQRIKAGESTAAEEKKQLRVKYPDINFNTLLNLSDIEKDFKPGLEKAKRDRAIGEKRFRSTAVAKIREENQRRKKEGLSPLPDSEANINAVMSQLKGE